MSDESTNRARYLGQPDRTRARPRRSRSRGRAAARILRGATGVSAGTYSPYARPGAYTRVRPLQGRAWLSNRIARIGSRGVSLAASRVVRARFGQRSRAACGGAREWNGLSATAQDDRLLSWWREERHSGRPSVLRQGGAATVRPMAGRGGYSPGRWPHRAIDGQPLSIVRRPAAAVISSPAAASSRAAAARCCAPRV